MPRPVPTRASDSGRKSSKKTVGISDLSVGDVVLFSEKNGAFVSVRACRWIAYTFAAFVVHQGNGDVELCGHFPIVSTDTEFSPSHTPSIQRFRGHLQTARYEAIYIRRLRHPLDDKQVSAVQHLAQRACVVSEPHGIGSHASDEEVVVLMASVAETLWSRLSCAPHAERFLTSRLVGDMLVAAGQAQDDGHRFVATTADERLLLPIQELSPADFSKARLSSRRAFRSMRAVGAAEGDGGFKAE